MKRLAWLPGALMAAPLFSQGPDFDPQVRRGEFSWFALTESKADVARTLGAPAVVAEFGPDFVSWQYRTGDTDHDEFSHYLVFRKSTGTLVSVTRTFESERNVDVFFPRAETVAYTHRSAGAAAYSVRVRRFADGRPLLAMGAARPGDTTAQLLLIRLSELRYFQGRLHEQLQAASTLR